MDYSPRRGRRAARWSCGAVVLALVVVAHAAVAASIDGPETVKPGHPAWFQITDMPARGTAFWFVTDHLQVESRYMQPATALFWAAAPGKYRVSAIVVAIEKDNLVGESLSAVVKVEGDAPVPPPPPPDPPSPLTGLSKLVYDWALTETPQAKRVVYASALSRSYDGMAAKIAAGAVKTPQDIIDQTTAANRAAIGEAGRTAWLPFFQQLRVHCNTASKAGLLVTPEHHAAAWRQIAKGLEAVR